MQKTLRRTVAARNFRKDNIQIRNLTKKAIIAKDCFYCTTTSSHARGLMFCRKKNLIMQFDDERIIPLHMVFVFFPIDVIYADRNKKVVEVKENFLPFSFHTPKKKATYVIEISRKPKTKTYINDRLQF
jgi:uncharacterized protein